MRLAGDSEDLYRLGGATVSASHSVKRGGVWRHVKDTPEAQLIHGERTLYNFITEKHLIYVGNMTKSPQEVIVAADFLEAEEEEALCDLRLSQLSSIK